MTLKYQLRDVKVSIMRHQGVDHVTMKYRSCSIDRIVTKCASRDVDVLTIWCQDNDHVP